MEQASIKKIIISELISLLLPVGLAFYFYRKYRFSLKAIFVGTDRSF